MKHLLSLLLLLFISAGCKKEKAPNTVLAEMKNIAKIEFVLNGQTDFIETYAYGNDGKLTGYTYDVDVETFEYSDNSFLKVTRRHKETNAITGSFEAVLNNKGAITELKYKNASGLLTVSYTYLYNEDGYMIKRKSVNVPSNFTWEYEYKIDNGNAVSFKAFGNGTQMFYGEYTYDITHTASVPRTPDYTWVSPTLFGRPLKNAVAAYKLFKVADGSLTEHIVYTNQYDQAGRLSTQDLNFMLTGKKGTYTFTYL